MELRFIWDRRKAESNLRKHRVSLDEASTVFLDPIARIFDDEDHSAEEAREIIIGNSARGMLMLVSFVETPTGIVRIISARLATRQERRSYEEGRKV